MGRMAEELLEAEAVEEDAPGVAQAEAPTRALPQRRGGGELSPWVGEVRNAALAAAGGLVAGAATVAAVRATRGAPGRAGRRALRSRQRPGKVVASRSFLVDVHLLER